MVEDAEELDKLVTHHVFPLAALGTRQSSAEHIVHSILLRMRLECSSWAAVQQMLRCTFSLTADQGTESHIADIEEVNLATNFPWWCPLPPEETFGPDGEEGAAAPGTPDEPRTLSFVTSVRIPPHFHIVDKVTKSFLSALSCWPRAKPSFQAVLVVFHARHTRSYFSVKCIPEVSRWLFRSGPPAWEGGRAWGVLQNAVKWLVKREGVIRRNTDPAKLAKLKEGNAGDQAQDLSWLLTNTAANGC
jgi:hypothetical protein